MLEEVEKEKNGSNPPTDPPTDVEAGLQSPGTVQGVAAAPESLRLGGLESHGNGEAETAPTYSTEKSPSKD